jgi:succinyl-CoA synthetase alpha subunit
MKKVYTEKSAYVDSVRLMRISKKVSDAPGIRNAMVAMATDTNLLLLKEIGFDTSGLGAVSANDMVIALDAEDEAALGAGLSLVKMEIEGGARPQRDDTAGIPVTRSLESAIKQYPQINLVLISTPGRFAAYEAHNALRAGKHVMIFSDNVSLEDEQRLKALASEKGLLLMGPDCGTAMIGGAGLGFANMVPRGRIGIVAASGTGAQEVSSILARLGLGVSEIIGTGGRDVSGAIGGVMTKMGLRVLVDDGHTDVIVIISKLPGANVAKEILEIARDGGKPCVVYFVGYSGKEREANLIFTRTLTRTALEAARLATGRAVSITPPPQNREDHLARLRTGLPHQRKFVRGLFSGGTLAQEAVSILGTSLRPMHVNMKLPGAIALDDPAVSAGHTIVDLGDDAFTRGRAHPMIDQAYRLTRLAREVKDPETAVVLMDVVLGYGCNEDPGGEIADVLRRSVGTQASEIGEPIVVASICGTHGDPQNYDLQRQKLEAAGVLVAETNAEACELALDLLRDR